MRQRWKQLADFCGDRLTIQERWLVFFVMLLVVLGTLAKYYRTRPEPLPASAVSPALNPPSADQ